MRSLSRPPPRSEIESLGGLNRAEIRSLREPELISHGFGTLICDGRAVEHTFRISNPLSEPLRVVRALAMVPCCSALGPIGSTVPAQGWLVTTRRWVGEGPAAPATLTSSTPIRAEYAGPPRVQQSGDGLVRVDREIDVTLPESRSPGHFQAEMVIGCEDGTSIKEFVAWEVEETFRVVPSGLVLFKRDGPSIKTFRVDCTDRPFRILGVENPLADRPPAPVNAESRPAHRLDIELDPSRSDPGKRYDIMVRTDQPDRPEIAISALVLDRTQGEGR